MTSIIMLSYNTLGYTKLAIESIRKHTAPGTYEIIVVENASKDGSREWLEQQDDIRLLCNEENVGFPKGCNQGLRIAKGDTLLLLNSDVIVTPYWLESLSKGLFSSKDVGAVSCLTNFCSNYQTIPAPYHQMSELERFGARINRRVPARYERRLRLIMFCFLFRREVYEAIGNLDEKFSPGNFEDDDYSFRIQQAGWKVLLCRDTYIHHFGSGAFLSGKSKEEQMEKAKFYDALLKRNKEYILKKYNIPPDYVLYSTQELFPQWAKSDDPVVTAIDIDRKRERTEENRRRMLSMVFLLSADTDSSVHRLEKELLQLHAVSEKKLRVYFIYDAKKTSVTVLEKTLKDRGIDSICYDINAHKERKVQYPFENLPEKTLQFLQIPERLPKELSHVLYVDAEKGIPKDVMNIWDAPCGDTVAFRPNPMQGKPSPLESEGVLNPESRFCLDFLQMNLTYFRERMDLWEDGLAFFSAFPMVEGRLTDMLRYFFEHSYRKC